MNLETREEPAALVAEWIAAYVEARGYTPIADRTNARWVVVYPDTWRRWFAEHHAYEAALERTASKAALLAVDGLRDLTEAERTEANEFRRLTREPKAVDRRILQHVAREAIGKPSDDEALITAWATAMMWGSGRTNGRGPRNTRKSLSDSNLVCYLRASVQDVGTHDFTQTVTGTKIKGVGLAFSSKWAWVLSLGAAAASVHLVLDARVRETLDRVSHGLGKTLSYADYLRLATDAATQIGGVTAEDVEYLLFARNKKEPNSVFYGWLLENKAS